MRIVAKKIDKLVSAYRWKALDKAVSLLLAILVVCVVVVYNSAVKVKCAT